MTGETMHRELFKRPRKYLPVANQNRLGSSDRND